MHFHVPLGYELWELEWSEAESTGESSGQSVYKNEIKLQPQVTAEYLLVLHEEEMNYCQCSHCE